MENAFTKSSKQIDELIKQNWAYMHYNMDKKNNMRKSLASFVKADKANDIRWTSCQIRVTKY